MTNITSPEQILSYARTNNWLALFTSDGNILNVFLTPNGNILEVYFEKNKATLKVLPSYVCK
ncbi:MAG: hypothetical protein ABSA18_01115 [Dehalococcoidia bacterium]|jgi:hypothetical protein